MKINYEVKCEDVVAFNIQHLKQLPHVKKLQQRSRIALSSLYGLIALGLFIYEPAHWLFSWVLMFVAILWYLFYSKVWEIRMAKKIKKAFNGKETTINELEFNGEGILAKNNSNKGEIPWSTIKRIIYGDKYIFLYLTEDNAIIIPKTGVEVSLPWEQLLDCITAWGQKNAISMGFRN